MKKNYTCLRFPFILFFVIIPFLKGYSQTGFSNITISTAVTSGGSFTGTAPARVFTLTADNAVINVSALVTELLSNNVTISTARAGGNEPGNINIASAITAASTTTTQRLLTLTAAGNITIGATVNLTPAAQSGNNAGRPATNITMTAGGNVSITGALTVNGGNASSSGTFGSGGDGGAAGDISITSTGSFSNTSAITATGGNGSSAGLSFTSRAGGAGGTLAIVSSTSVAIGGALTANGGGASLVGNGGAGGGITTTANPGFLSITANLTNNGGSGVEVNGGGYSLRGTTGIRITGNITSTGGGIGDQGNITINDGATTVTTGGGVNDGQTAGVINVGNLTKSGNGTFYIAGTNTYTGNTTISAGALRVSAAVAPNANGALGADGIGNIGGAEINLNGGGIEFNHATFTRAIIVNSNSRVDAFGAARSVSPAISGTAILTVGVNTVSGGVGQDLSLGGVISGTLSLVKSGSSMLTLSAANTFTGTKTLTAGTLNINNASALGTVAGTFIINGGTINNTTAAAITTLAYPQTWGGDFSFTGTQNLNLGAGAITMSANRQVTVNAGTLTTGGIINAPLLNLTKAGAGILHMGATAKTLNSLVISAGGFTSTSNTLSIADDFTNDGTFTHNSGTVVFNGSVQSISGVSTTAFSTITILSGSTTTGVAAHTAATFNLNSGAKYIQTAGTTIPGTTKNFVAGSTYELQASNVTFSGATYGNLILNYAAGNVSAAGNLTSILNDLYVLNTGTGSFRLAATTSPSVTIAGNLRIDGGRLNFSTGTGAPVVTVNGNVLLNGGVFQPMISTGVPSMFVNGSWTNNGSTFTPGTSTVTFSSTSASQSIGGSVTNAFYNLTNSNTNISGLTLAANTTVTNILSFSSSSNGFISTGSNILTVSNAATAAIVRPGTGHVIGNLTRSIATAGGIYEFTVGTSSGYTPVSLSFNNGNTAGNVNATTANGVSPNYPGTLNSTKRLARRWTITNGGAGIFNANAVFTFLPGDLLNGATAANLKGYKFISPSAYSYSPNTSVTSNTFSFNGITSLGEFGAGECGGSLFVNAAITDVTCYNENNGALVTTVTGNLSPVTYIWNTTPVQTTPNISGLTAGFYMVTVSEPTTCSASNTFSVNQPPPVASPVSGGNQTVCSDGDASQTLTANATSEFPVIWYNAASGGSIVPNPTQVGVGSVTYYAAAFNGTCYSFIRTGVTLTINAVPDAPVSGGNMEVCSDGTTSQTLTATATSPATITWYDSETGGNVVANPVQTGPGTVLYYAEANNGLCSSLTRTLVSLTINPPPAAPVSGGNQIVCSNGSPLQTITATATGDGDIIWYNAASGGNIVASPSQTGIGTVTYYAEVFDGSCSSLTRTAVTLTINPAPAVPGNVSGPRNVCPYIGTGEQVTYSIDAVPFANTYRWSLPSTVNLVSATADSTSITVTIASNFISVANKVIKVRSVSTCGNSTDKLLYLLAQFPSTPGPITGITDICPYLGTGAEVTYKINKITAATSYAWSLQAGTTTVTHVNSPGPNDTIIKVVFDNNFTTSPVTVAAVNDCGTSGSVRSLTILRVSAPRPGLITGPVNVCPYILPNGTAATYSITPVPGATSYTWTAPANSVVTHVNPSGSNDVSITVQFPAGFTNGLISVSATNGCGNSATARTLSISRLNPATPGVLDVIQTAGCPDREYTYTLAVMPANATSINWTVPATALSYTVLTPLSIKVFYPSTAVSGAVTATAVNNCGTSVTRQSAVKLPACTAPQPFTGTNGEPQAKNTLQDATAIATEVMEVKVFPNPAISDFKVQVITANNEKIHVRILDLNGRILKTMNLMPYQVITIGSELKAGIYIIEVTQGKTIRKEKLVKF